MKLCEHCNKEIFFAGPTQKYHKECSGKVKYIRSRDKNKVELKTGICKVCGKTYAFDFAGRKYCSKKCAARAKNDLDKFDLESINTKIVNKYLLMPVHKPTL